MKYLIRGLFFLGATGGGMYYLYMYDKPKLNQEVKSPADSQIQENQAKNTTFPIYLTPGFWEIITTQELESLLKQINDVNEVRSDNKQSMLHLLVQYGKNPDMVKRLISAGVDYNLEDKIAIDNGEIENRNALFYSIIRKNQAYEFSEPFLEHIDVNASLNNDEVTPLILASYFRQPKIVQILLQKGANPNLTEKIFGWTSLMATIAPNEFGGSSYIDPKTIQLLLDYKADLTIKNKNGVTAFDLMKQNEEFKKTDLFKKISQMILKKP